MRAEISIAVASGVRAATTAVARIERRERDLEQLYSRLKNEGLEAVVVVGETIAAARLARKKSDADLRDALLAAHGLERRCTPLSKPLRIGERLIVATLVGANVLSTLPALVVAEASETTVELDLGGNVARVPLTDLASWAVPILADGSQTRQTFKPPPASTRPLRRALRESLEAPPEAKAKSPAAKRPRRS